MEDSLWRKEALDDALTSVKTATEVITTHFLMNVCMKNVRNVMLKILEQEHEIQDDVFKIMHDKGLYPTQRRRARR